MTEKTEKEDKARRFVEKCGEQTVLAEIAKNAPLDNVRTDAVTKLTDQTVLTEVAKHDESSVIRGKAIARLTDKAKLEDVIKNGKVTSRSYAKQRLEIIHIREMSRDEVFEYTISMKDETPRSAVVSEIFDRIPGKDLPELMAKASENVAKQIFTFFMTKNCMQEKNNAGTFSEEKIATQADLMKEMWDRTPYASLKAKIAVFICIYFPEVADYTISNDIEMGITHISAGIFRTKDDLLKLVTSGKKPAPEEQKHPQG